MEFLDIAAQRQSCRDFDSSRPVEKEKLLKCIEAARLAPSACNSQPWSFVVVTTPQKVKEVAGCAIQNGSNEFIADATAFIIVVEQHARLMPKARILDSQYFAKGDLGAARAHICLEAATQGFSSCIIGMFNREILARVLDMPIETRFFSLIALGYPKSEEIRPKNRKNLEEIVKFI